MQIKKKNQQQLNTPPPPHKKKTKTKPKQNQQQPKNNKATKQQPKTKNKKPPNKQTNKQKKPNPYQVTICLPRGLFWTEPRMADMFNGTTSVTANETSVGGETTGSLVSSAEEFWQWVVSLFNHPPCSRFQDHISIWVAAKNKQTNKQTNKQQ